jgi:type VI secretion system protein ImpG
VKDAELLRRYNEELHYLRELGGEFAREFPGVAAGLRLGSTDPADPYVERLLEGFAFLSARIRGKLDAEYPALIQHLLEAVQPQFIAPVPSMTILRFTPDLASPHLARGVEVPRGTAATSAARCGQDTACEFRTAHAVVLWPLSITSVRCTSHVPDLPLAALPVASQVRGALRIRLQLHGGATFDQLPLDTLALHVAAGGSVGWRLHELVAGAAIGSWVPSEAAPVRPQWRGAHSVQPLGFDDDQALLPETLRGFSGHRLVQEFAALPRRLLFFEINDLAPRLVRVHGTQAEIVILLSRGDAALESLVDAGSLALFCTPAINLFRKRLDPIDVGSGYAEHHVIADRTRPVDYEIHTIESVVGHGHGVKARQRFVPLYGGSNDGNGQPHTYFTLRREPRRISQREADHDGRTSGAGSEVWIALVDRDDPEGLSEIRHLATTAWLTNRDLPLLLPPPVGSGAEPSAWSLEAPAPVLSIATLVAPTRPIDRLPQGEAGWALVSLATLNHLALVGDEPARVAATLRAMLRLFGGDDDPAWSRQVDGLVGVLSTPVTRRLPGRGRLVFGCGIDVQLEIDETAFEGGSAFAFGAVLDRFLARHAAINSFVQTTLRSTTRGVRMRWPARSGAGLLL